MEVVSLSIFQEVHNRNLTPDANMQRRIQELVTKYPCFRPEMSSHSTWRNSKPAWRNRRQPHTLSESRTPLVQKRLFQPITEDDVARKEFISYLNKLSIQNAKQIIQSILKILRPNYIPLYIQLVWEIMMVQHDYQELYIELLNEMKTVLDEVSIANECKILWEGYVNKEGWLLKLHKQQDAYNDFCDYVKEKKCIYGALKAWMTLLDHQWIHNVTPHTLIGYLLKAISDIVAVAPCDKEQLECLFQQIYNYMRYAVTIEDFKKLLYDDWGQYNKNWSPFVKFKWLDIKESYERNYGLHRLHR